MVLKTERTGVEKKFFDLCSKVVAETGLSLYDLEFVPRSGDLRVYIINDETSTAVLDDCVKVDKALTPYFETEEWMPEGLTLEVSSPGLFRQLTTKDHFDKIVGEKVALNLQSKLTEESFPGLPRKLKGSKKIKATLKEVGEDFIVLEEKDFAFELKFSDIKKANLETDITGQTKA